MKSRESLNDEEANDIQRNDESFDIFIKVITLYEALFFFFFDYFILNGFVMRSIFSSYVSTYLINELFYQIVHSHLFDDS